MGNLQEDPRNDDTLLLQRFLEEAETVVEGFGEGGEVEPDVEGCDGWDGDWETHFGEALEAVISFDLEGRQEGQEGGRNQFEATTRATSQNLKGQGRREQTRK